MIGSATMIGKHNPAAPLSERTGEQQRL